MKKFAYITMLIGAVLVLFSRFLYSGDGYLAFYSDDFFYYLKIAENIANDFHSSFNRIHITNGYHPLWILVIVLIVKMTGANGISFFIFLNIIIFILTILTFLQAKKLLEKFVENKYFLFTILLFFIERYLSISKTGMEVILTVPLILFLFNYIFNNFKSTNKTKFYLIFGILSSLVILSRIDSIIMIFLLILVFVIKNNESHILKIKNLIYFISGFIPLILYLISNLYFFDTLLPISGMAKQLRMEYTFSTQIFNVIVPYNLQSIFSFIMLILTLIFMFFNFRKFSFKLDMKILLLQVIPFFFIIHFLVLSIFSGWQLWYWYVYSILISFLISAIGFTIHYNSFLIKIPVKIKKGLFLAVGLYLLLWSFTFSAFKKPSDNELYSEAKHLSKWMKKHQGVYAMGDRAGLISYLSGQTMIQLEGLVMDRNYLENIIHQKSLNSVLEKYNIDYYITAVAEKNSSNCYTTHEPYLSKVCGNKYMTGLFYSKPVFEFKLRKLKYYVFKIKK